MGSVGVKLPPQMAGEFFGDGGAVFGPFVGEEGGPVRSGGEAFADWGAQAEENGEAAFAEGGADFRLMMRPGDGRMGCGASVGLKSLQRALKLRP